MFLILRLAMNEYIVATIKDWNIDNFNKLVDRSNEKWHLFTQPEELNLDALRQIEPKYIFFPHWSWIVPKEIYQEFECICFHMADVPYGRGGSPLQNLIVRGHKKTKLTALKMVKELDAGPVYLKKDLSLDGSADDIFKKCSTLAFNMMEDIITHQPLPQSQIGDVVEFERRKPEQSRISGKESPEQLFDLIRMLDADTYPRAFIEYNCMRIEFSDADFDFENGVVKATVNFNRNRNE